MYNTHIHISRYTLNLSYRYRILFMYLVMNIVMYADALNYRYIIYSEYCKLEKLRNLII